MSYSISAGAMMGIRFQGSLFGQMVMNTFNYRYDGPIIANGLTFLNNLLTINATMQANCAIWQDCISSDVTDNRIIGQWIFPLRYRLYNAPMANATGTGGPASTANVASVVTLVSDLASRHGVGNKHLPGLPVDSQTQGFLTNPQLVNNGFLGVAMASPITILGGVLTPVIYNRTSPSSSLEVIGSEQNNRVRVQRRRTVGLGK